ncbi:uncharacterized protein LOC120668584 isoform X2 [Panicum virgatum]|uniref:uncharacterized protein LOC120668584 isoform X2 n=1 Tax=Panicum virgatum TaxID=38727 RepID=UPI0019D6A8C1|nr:uncharacterized protein LOC120668584 isoform X2 [Panicum virgatum]
MAKVVIKLWKLPLNIFLEPRTGKRRKQQPTADQALKIRVCSGHFWRKWQPVADCGASGWRSELRIMAPGRGAWPGCGYAPFTFGALGDVYVCENERKEGSVGVCLGPTAYDSVKMTYASMGCGSMDGDKRKYGR